MSGFVAIELHLKEVFKRDEEIAALKARLAKAESVCEHVEFAFGGGEPGSWTLDLGFPETRDLVAAWDAWREGNPAKS